MKGFFITGTDTGVGKTFTTCALARAAKGRVFAFKPIETGCELIEGRLVGADQELISKAAGNWQTGELRGVYKFKAPLAPRVAAEREGTQVDLDRITSALKEGSRNAETTLVEGAGGWRVPITKDLDMSELARRTGFPVLVVARAGLGTINHTLLTVEAIDRDGFKVAAVMISRRPDEALDQTQSNVEEIERAWKGRVRILGPESIDELLAS